MRLQVAVLLLLAGVPVVDTVGLRLPVEDTADLRLLVDLRAEGTAHLRQALGHHLRERIPSKFLALLVLWDVRSYATCRLWHNYSSVDTDNSGSISAPELRTCISSTRTTISTQLWFLI
jgi:hypothetical protein